MTADLPSSTRDRLLDATVSLMRTKGAAASGTKEILELAQAPRGSFYFHFPDGKDQLVLAAMERAAAVTRAALDTALADPDGDLAEQVRSLFTGIEDELVAQDYAPGCAVAVTTVESASGSPRFQGAVDAAFTSWTSTVAERLVAHGLPAEQALALADAIVAATEGATILARARRSPVPLRHAADLLAFTIHAITGSRNP